MKMKNQHHLPVITQTQLNRFSELIILLKVFSVIAVFVVAGIVGMVWSNLLENTLTWFLGD